MTAPPAAPVLRQEFRLPPADEAGLSLHVRHVRPAGLALGSVVLVHGATLASGLWDIAVPGYSLLEALARSGLSAWALDVRGYARSDRLPKPTRAYAGLTEAVADISATVEHVCTHDGVPQVGLIGGSWGSITSARYASAHPQRVAALALMAPIFAMRNPSWLADLADPAAPGVLHPQLGATRLVGRADLLRRWDAEMAGANPTDRRDPRVLDALMADSLAPEDSPAAQAFWVPNGTLLDLFEAFSGRPLYDPAMLKMPVLLARGEHDGTSTAADLQHLRSRLGSAVVEVHTIANAGHFICAERAAPVLQQRLVGFLSRHAGHASLAPSASPAAPSMSIGL